MMRIGLIRTIGWVQMVFSIILIIGITTAYFFYRSSLADYSRALAESMFSVSGFLTNTAEKMKARQELIQDVQKVLKISSDLLVALKASVETQAEKMPQYSADLKKAAVVTGKLGNTLTEVGNGLMLAIPINIVWHLTSMPQIVWARPLDAQANALKAHGQNINALSGNLTAIADSLVTDVPKLNSALIGASQKTLELLRDVEDATAKLGPEFLPQTIERLKDTSQKLRQAGDLADRAEQMGLVLFAASLILALLLALNSVAMLLLASQHANK